MRRKSSFLDNENQIPLALEAARSPAAPIRELRSNVVSIGDRVSANQLKSKVSTYDRLLEFSRKLP